MPSGVYIRTKEHGENISKSLMLNHPLRGKHLSAEHRLHLSQALTGRSISEETKTKLRLLTPWNKGKKGCISKESLEKMSGENSVHWKGDQVGYDALHEWVEKQLGKPKKCDNCGTEEAKVFDWANISHEYKRDLTDWIRLCRKDHIAYDKGRLVI